MATIDEESKSDREAVMTGKITEAVYFERCTRRAHTERNRLVAFLSSIFPAALFHDDGDDETPPSGLATVYIDTPAGQLSWHVMPRDELLFVHLPKFEGQWDGHTTEEKYQRLERLAGWEPLQRAIRQNMGTRGTSAETASARAIPGVKIVSGDLTACHIIALGLMQYDIVKPGFNAPPQSVSDLTALGLARESSIFKDCFNLTDAGRAKLKELGWRA
jgi:hypothetical protein